MCLLVTLAGVASPLPTLAADGAEAASAAKNARSIRVAPLKMGAYRRELDGVGRDGRSEVEATLRASGYRVEKQKDAGALELQGKVERVACASEAGGTCGIEVDFALGDPDAGVLLYRLRARHVVSGTNALGAEETARRLVSGVTGSMLRRDAFHRSAEETEDAVYAARLSQASLRSCGKRALAMPKDSPAAMRATAVVQDRGGTGSALFVSPDGYLLTAAHVVGDAEKVGLTLKDGTKATAKVVRIDEGADVALLRVTGDNLAGDKLTGDKLTGEKARFDCLDPAPEAASVGEEVYVIGAPAGEALSFSISRGIVSGQRRINGQDYLQTDASINPGNSGGPVLDEQGRVLGVVSWKLADTELEGLGFAVPIDRALEVLSVDFGASTTASLSRETRASNRRRVAVVDRPDPKWAFSSDAGDGDGSSSSWVGPTIGAGALLVVLGGTTAAVALASSGSGTSYSDRQTADTWAAVGFATAGVGAAAVLTALIVPPLTRPKAGTAHGGWQIQPVLGPVVGVHVSY